MSRLKPSFARFGWIIFVTSFLVVPNLPLLLAGRPLNLLLTGYIDLDYLLIGLLALFLPRVATFLLLLLAVVLDFIQAACATYLFSPSEFINSIRFGGMLSTTRAEVIFGTFALVFLVCLLTSLTAPRSDPVIASFGRARGIAATSLLILLFTLPLLQLVTTHGHLFATSDDSAMTTPIRIPSFSLIRKQRNYDRNERGDRLAGMFPMPSASAIALTHLRDSLPQSSSISSPQAELPDFVQVLVESWGLPDDKALRKALLMPYSDPRLLEQYRVISGTMPFQGPTTSGEARELCQSHVGYNASHGSIEQMQHCLPMHMRGMGYSTLAVHGFKAEMFDRDRWYPQMGFQDNWFHDRLFAADLPDCPGPFPGTCDASVATWLGDRLAQPAPAPLFVHWVTLNSHLPVPVPAPLKSPQSCSVSAATSQNPQICSWYQLVSVVHDSVRDLALRPLSRPAIFVIVGDHAPPFDRQEIRGRFSAAEVPYVILLPRTRSGPSLSGY